MRLQAGRSRRRAPRRAAHPLRPPLPLELARRGRCAVRSSWIGDRLDSVFRPIGRMLGDRSRRRSGWPSRSVVVALVVVGRRARRGAGVRGAPTAPRRRGAVPTTHEDPDALERAADAAERDGDLDRAVRLRFRAGLLRLGDRGAIRVPAVGDDGRGPPHARLAPLRRSRRHVRSRDVRRARRRPARRRRGPAGVAARARRIRAPVTEPTPARRSAIVVGSRSRSWSAACSSSTSSPQGLDRAVGGDQPGGATGLVVRDRARRARRVRLAARRTTTTTSTGSAARSPRTRRPTDATVFVIEPDRAHRRRRGDAARQFVTERRPAGDRRRRRRSTCATCATDPPKWQPTGATSWTADRSRARQRARHRRRGRRIVVGARERHGARRHRRRRARSTREQVGRGEIFFLADASPLENEYLGDRRQRRVRARARRATRTARWSSPKACTATARAAGFAAIPDRWKIALAPRRGRRARVRVVAGAALRSARSDARAISRPPAPSTCRRCRSASSARTTAPARSRPRSAGRARRVAARAGLGAERRTTRSSRARRASFGCTDEEIAALARAGRRRRERPRAGSSGRPRRWRRRDGSSQ